MELSPGLKRFLEKIGINTTRLQWRLYQWERKRERMSQGVQLPASLHWLKYPHKRCFHCGTINAREDKRCTHCNRRLLPMPLYRVVRLLGTLLPEGAAPVSQLYLGAIIVAFVLMLIADGFASIFAPSGHIAFAFGAFRPVHVLQSGEYWRILSFSLVHFGIIHLLFNVVALYQIGPIVEGVVGRLRMLVVISVTQAGSAAATYLWYVQIQGNIMASTVGASGVVFGLIGYGFAYFRTFRGGLGQQYAHILRNWMIAGLLFGFIVAGINNAAHIGGLAAGYLLAQAPMESPRNPRLAERLWLAAILVCGVLWTLTLVYMTRSVISGWNSPQ